MIHDLLLKISLESPVFVAIAEMICPVVCAVYHLSSSPMLGASHPMTRNLEKALTGSLWVRDDGRRKQVANNKNGESTDY